MSGVLFNYPLGLSIVGPNDYVVADSGNYRVRRITNGAIQTIAGNGYVDGKTALSTNFNVPSGVAVTPAGDLYIADQINYKIRKSAAGSTNSPAFRPGCLGR